MSMESDGFEKLNAKAECRDQYSERAKRLKRIGGYERVGEPYDDSTEQGFIPRNNVDQRG
jgi:hypothetical protein